MHWSLNSIGLNNLQMWIWKTEWKTAFRPLLFLSSWVQRLRLLTLAASLARLPFKPALWLQRQAKDHKMLDSLRILFGNLVFAMDGEGHKALQLHRDKPSFVRCVQSNEQTKETMRWVMYDPDMITASILGTQGVRGRNFMGSMFGEQIDVKLSTLKCQHYTPYFTHLKIERQETCYSVQ